MGDKNFPSHAGSVESRRVTQFPSNNLEGHLVKNNDKQGVANGDLATSKRKTQFPGGLGVEELQLVKRAAKNDDTFSLKGVKRPLQFPVGLNPRKSSSVQQSLTEEKKIQPESLIVVGLEDPWNHYDPIRAIDRGGRVMAAKTKTLPLKLIVVKEITPINSISIQDLAECSHTNLVAILAAYRFDGILYAIMEYTAVSLTQVIAIPLPLEEVHVSVMCSQVLRGMQHLLKYGLVHRRLDCSKVLLSADGCAKIAYISECTMAGTTDARPLGIIAMEMMQKGILPAEDEEFVLSRPERWSAEAVNFLEITSWGSLNDVEKHNFLKCQSMSLMIPHVEYARWATIESFGLTG